MTSSDARIQERYDQYFAENARRADRLFAVLMLVQFLAGVCGAIWLSPRTWAGSAHSIHLHVWASLFIGVSITAAPLYLILARPGQTVTRHTIAIAQMLFSTLLIHITGGRIETHFHVFGSLAFLAFYRDWRLFIPATVVIAADHLIRGVFWPESVFGVLTASPWRALEHAGWVLFEDTFLIYSCIQADRQLRQMCRAQITLEQTTESVEETVALRTRQLETANQSLKESDERYKLVVQGTREAVWDWDLATNKIYYAPGWNGLLGLPDQSPRDDSPNAWFSRITSRNLPAFQAELSRYIDGKTDRFDTEVEFMMPDGATRWMLCRAVASRNDKGVATRLTGSLTDVSELKEAQNKLRRLAEFDQLTGLLNREQFKLALSERLSERRDQHGFAVGFFDFDRFKVVNDSLGHNIGDALLCSIAERFTQTLRETDTVSRFGGDEFVVLFEGLDSAEDVRSFCGKLLKRFAEPHHIDGHSIVSTASIGVVLSSPRYHQPEEMIRDADAAMYRAKSSGRDSYQLFDAAMHDEAMTRLTLEHELRQAVEHDELELHYQPIVSTVSGRIDGFEALIRWNHPQRGLVSPADFIPIAEETGIIIDLGEWVFRQACRQLAQWLDGPGTPPNLMVTVNLSRRQMIHPRLVERLGQILNETGVPPAQVCIEITENALMYDRQDLDRTIQNIKRLGVLLALDDFGTGHSSLSSLHNFPIDILKIDKSFMGGLGERIAFIAVLNSIISLGHNLKMRVVGEGIETPEQLAQLQALDCEWAQGYYFSPPASAQVATDLLRDRPRWRAAA